MAGFVRKLSCGVLGSGRKLVFDGRKSLFTGHPGSPRFQVAGTKQQADSADKTGAESEVINPLKHPDFFGVRELFTMSDLFEARVHLGHKRGLRNPHMQPFLFGTRLDIDIIDLEKTVPLLEDALNFLAHIAFRQGVILFLSRHKQSMPLVESTAQECGEYAHCRYWRGGTFTNATVQYGAVTRLPDACVFLSTHNSFFQQDTAVIEATKMSIPTVGVVDSSCDPRLITYPIPSNDDSMCTIELYCRLFKAAILKGKEKFKELSESN